MVKGPLQLLASVTFNPRQKAGMLLRHAVPTRSGQLDTTRLGSVEADTVAHCADAVGCVYVNSLTYTELYSSWIENRAVWNKSADAVLAQSRELELVAGGFGALTKQPNLVSAGFPRSHRPLPPKR